MRSNLGKSFLLVALFWWGVSAVAWSLADPAVNRATLVQLAELFPWLGVNPPALPVSVLDAFSMQRQVFMYWSVPVLLLSLATSALGYGLTWLATWKRHDERMRRESPSGEFRGMRVTLGALPTPRAPRADVLNLGADADGLLDRLTEKQNALLTAVLGVLSAQGAEPGPDAGPAPLDAGLAAAAEALASLDRPGLRAVTAAAVQLGKLTSADALPERAGAAQARGLGYEAGRVLARLPAWWALPADERLAVMLAVKFHDRPAELPLLGAAPEAVQLARALLTPVSAPAASAPAAGTAKPGASVPAQPEPTQEPDVEVTPETLPDALVAALLRAMPMLSFQRPGQPKNVPAVGWNKGNRIYLIDNKLRDTLWPKLPEAVRVLVGEKPPKQRMHPFTQMLLQALHDKGWLVREIDKLSLDAKEALWNVKAGTLPFSGVFIVDLPDEYRSLLPAQDSHYDISVVGPTFRQPGSYATPREDLTDLLRPSTRAPDEAPPAPAPATPAVS